MYPADKASLYLKVGAGATVLAQTQFYVSEITKGRRKGYLWGSPTEDGYVKVRWYDKHGKPTEEETMEKLSDLKPAARTCFEVRDPGNYKTNLKKCINKDIFQITGADIREIAKEGMEAAKEKGARNADSYNLDEIQKGRISIYTAEYKSGPCDIRLSNTRGRGKAKGELTCDGHMVISSMGDRGGIPTKSVSLETFTRKRMRNELQNGLDLYRESLKMEPAIQNLAEILEKEKKR